MKPKYGFYAFRFGDGLGHPNRDRQRPLGALLGCTKIGRPVTSKRPNFSVTWRSSNGKRVGAPLGSLILKQKTHVAK